MSKKKTPATPVTRAVIPSSGTAAPPPKDTLRETIESIVIAFVLAFLFRTFEAEAFVIPTGSMAPTLMGVHKDIVCPKCGLGYRTGAAEEQDENVLAMRATGQHERADDYDVVAATCPNCRYTVNVDPKKEEGREDPSYKGDRILVAKFPYYFADPARWDVAVFRYPATAHQNYIKRVVGLPGETIEIFRGDIHTLDGDGRGRTLQRKPADKVAAVMQLVYDNDHVLPEIVELGWPTRWQRLDTAADGNWVSRDELKGFSIDAAPGTEKWLGYRHFPPSQNDWRFFNSGAPLPEKQQARIKPQLINDFYAYDARQLREGVNYPSGPNWVGDLIVEAALTVEQPQGEVVFRLVEGGHFFDCRIDLATGKATLQIPDQPDFKATAETPIKAAGTYNIRFANVDQQLFLWVDDVVADFDAPTTYEFPGHRIPNSEDLVPVRIASVGAKVELDHLRVLRDVYYIAVDQHTPYNGLYYDYTQRVFRDLSEAGMAEFLSNPAAWPEAFSTLRQVHFQLGDDDFFMLGDNSPRSKDGRLWTVRNDDGEVEYYVKRDLLTGKALFVYWPHSWNKPIPFFPNFGRMAFVR